MRDQSSAGASVTIATLLWGILGLASGCRVETAAAQGVRISAPAREPSPAQVETSAPREATASSLEPLRIAPTAPDPSQWKKPQRLLYVGLLDTPRARDFMAFLPQHFPHVATATYHGFSEAQAEGFDVTLVDYDGTDTSAPNPDISPAFSQPLMTLGVPGADFCSRLRLKTGYL